MKKRGFTLAEVLITLGIIGVVAALTAPQLVMSSKNEATCSKLATTVSNLENAFQNAIVQEGVTGLSETALGRAAAGAATAGQLGKYIHISNFNNNDIILKSGVRVTYNKTLGTNYTGTATENTIRNNGGSLVYKVGELDVWTAPDASNQRAGRNRFKYYIGNDGALYAFGSKDTAIYDSNGSLDTTKVYSKTATSGSYACSSSAQSYACTARLVDDGYKMNY